MKRGLSDKSSKPSPRFLFRINAIANRAERPMGDVCSRILSRARSLYARPNTVMSYVLVAYFLSFLFLFEV
ncbi:hypothetical protein EUGRSUZ_H04116 [Eucalyptus grandis]|uniref:Uncharacterized protein n=2 Tax=Eucalyptus grandis TaxID=71139 RepID=A0A059B596_EUCGR|nr:hypothetical protein EUGRSUZ_H04116 [Eucalyptus grandis]